MNKKDTTTKPAAKKPVNPIQEQAAPVSLSERIKGVFGKLKSKEPVPQKVFMIVCIVVVVLRLLTNLFPSYKVDIGVYKGWGYWLLDRGPGNFYNEAHAVYGPIYMYFLWFSAGFARILHLNDLAYEFLIKCWSVLSDLVGAYFIYLIGKKYEKARMALLLGVVYALNPGVLFNSSIWGQFDSFPAAFIIAVMYLFNIRKNLEAAVLFTIAVICKPQSGLFAPVVILSYFKGLSFKEKETWKLIGNTTASVIAAYVITIVPFFRGSTSNPVKWIMELVLWLPNHYAKSVGDYPYATANAFNIWTILRGQAVPDSDIFKFGISFANFGYLLFAVIVVLAVWLLLVKKKSVLALYYSTFMIYFGAFFFVTKMHERYLLPALVFITVCILWDSTLWAPMILLSGACFMNHFYLYQMSLREEFWVAGDDKTALYTAVVTAAVMLYCIYYLIRLGLKKKKKKVVAVDGAVAVEAPNVGSVEAVEVQASSKE